MKREKLEAIAAGAEDLAERNPGLYRAILVAMAVGSYIYIFLILAILLALLGLFIFMIFFTGEIHAGLIKLAIVVLIPIVLIVRSLWVRIPPPDGLRLKREDCPRLFEVIERIQTTLQAPPVSEIILDYDVNACVAQVPRLGLLGWYRNYLAVGLPLLQSLSPAQLRAVLAHEFGHLSGSHGKFGVWIYRLRQTWNQVLGSLSQSGSRVTYVFMPLYRWLMPRFSAFSLIQSRKHEFKADRYAADIAGADNLVNALVRLELASETFQKKFWNELYRKADKQDKPPSPFTMMVENSPGLGTAGSGEFLIKRRLNEKGEGLDTHPTLLARISALRNDQPVADSGFSGRLVCDALVETDTAAEYFLGDSLKRLSGELDKLWQKSIGPAWVQRKKEISEHAGMLAELEGRSGTALLTPAEEWTRSCLTEEIHGKETALPLYQSVLATAPDNMQAMFAVGRILLSNKDSDGVKLIETVMSKEADSRSAGASLLSQYYYEIGDVEGARKWRFEAEDSYADVQKIEQEKSLITEKDKFVPHGLDEKVVAAVREKVAETGFKGRVYMVKKKLKHVSDGTYLVLVIVRQVPWWKYQDSAATATHDQQLLDDLTKKLMPLGLDYSIFFLGKSSLLKRISRISGSEIYS